MSDARIAELEAEIAGHVAARYAVTMELADWTDAEGPGALCGIRKLKAEVERLEGVVENNLAAWEVNEARRVREVERLKGDTQSAYNEGWNDAQKMEPEEREDDDE